MRSKWLLNLVLLALVIGLTTAAFFRAREDERAQRKPPLLTLDGDRVVSIEIERDKQDGIALEKRGGRWHITVPLRVPADEDGVRRLLGIAGAEVEQQYSIEGLELSKFGLDSPKATLRLDDVLIEFGGRDPVSRNRYVRAGGRLNLVVDDLYYRIAAPAGEFIDRKLLPAPPARIELPDRTLTRDENGVWRSEPPGEDAAAAGDTATAWGQAAANRVNVTASGAPAGERVRIGFADRAPIEFSIRRRQPELVLARPDLGIEYQIPAETGARLLTLIPANAEAAPP